MKMGSVPVRSLPRITGLKARCLRLRAGQHGDRGGGRVGHLRAEPAVLDGIVGGVAGGEYPPARAREPSSACRSEGSRERQRPAARGSRAGDPRHGDDPLVLQLDALRLDEQPACAGTLASELQ